MAKTNYISIFENLNSKNVGNKFTQLAKVNQYCNVPKSVCLNSCTFKNSLEKKSWNLIQNNLRLLHSNGGYRLNKIQKEIQNELKKIDFSDELKNELKHIYDNLSNNGKLPLITRSSSNFEDRENISGAGVYQSFSEINSFNSLLKGVRICWFSAFSLTAIAHRLRIKEFNIDPLPGVIIQRFIKSDFSGVVFSENPLKKLDGIFVEYTTEGSDGIEAGTGKSKSFMAIPKPNKNGEYIINANDLPIKKVNELIDLSKIFNKTFQKKMEFEWVISKEKLYILQTRPITASKHKSQNNKNQEIFKVFDLYLESKKIEKRDMGEIKGIYEHSISKRKTIRLFAIKHNIAINGSAVIFASHLGIKNLKNFNFPSLNRLNTPIFTIDLGPHLRSFYTKRSKVKKMLAALLKYSVEETPIIVREFASGEYSAVTTPKGETKILVEICRGSLMGINRGFVKTDNYLVDLKNNSVKKISKNISHTSRYYDFDRKTNTFLFVNPDKNAPKPLLRKSSLLMMAHFTKDVENEIKTNILEWTILNGKPIYIDNTPLDTNTLIQKSTETLHHISPGTLSGEILTINNLKNLEYISSGPTLNVDGYLPTIKANKEIQQLIQTVEKKNNFIIVSKFPYTALSVLIGKVKGFIFESGPVLCHLAIIARENNTPIVIVKDALSRYKSGEHISL